jgi:pheromone shutdown-related protein TraB
MSTELPASPSPTPSEQPFSFSENVHVLDHAGRKVYLIGTAHVSEDSVDEVEHVIETVRPDTVCVELCQTRFDALMDEDRWKKLDIFKVIRDGKALFLMANLAISGYQRRIGADLGVQPGSELLGAAKKGEEVGAKVDLIDRNIQTTLKRTWANVGFFKKVKLLGAVFGSLLPGEEDEVTKEDIEKLKSGAQLSELMEEFSKALPEVKEPLIDERDLYMVEGIRQAPGKSIVAVVGAGHVPGMLASFEKSIDREALDVIPPTKLWVKALKWLIPGLILAAFALGISAQDGGRTFEELLMAWVLPNSIVAAIMTTLVLAKPVSIVAAFIASPITSLNPLLGAGMVVGLVEAWARRPTVADCENIHRDVQSFRGFFKNPFTRVLIVAAAATIGSALGAWIGATLVVTIVTA